MGEVSLTVSTAGLQFDCFGFNSFTAENKLQHIFLFGRTPSGQTGDNMHSDISTYTSSEGSMN